MTFDKLHQGIKEGCDCLEHGSAPDSGHVFWRRGSADPAATEDFLSYLEMGIECSGNSCKNHCEHRGVSIYQIESDLNRRKTELKSSYQLKPTPQQKFMYFVRVKDVAGMVWYQGKVNGHCELLKADGFSLEAIEFVDVFDLSDPN